MGPLLSKFVSAISVRQLPGVDVRLQNGVSVTRNVTHNRATQLDAFELEGRVLYSATPLDLQHDIQSELNSELDSEALEEAFFPDQTETSSFTFPADNYDETAFEFVLDASESIGAFDPLTVASESFAQQIVFIDTNVEDWQQLLVGLESETSNQNTSIFLLDESRDGIEQISQTLARYTNVAAIHLISHGSENELILGGTSLSSQNLNGFTADLMGWRDSLADGADLLIYGCNLASSESGRELIDGLGALCNCDVAASEDLTGHSTLGGDWDLEYHSGFVETEILITAQAQHDWVGTLANFTVTSTADDGLAGTLRWAIGQANSTGGLDTIDFNISDADTGHIYYRDDGVAGTLSLVASTTLADAAITDFDPDYPYASHSWFRIDVDDSLPQLSITDAVIIDGYSQPGASQNTLATGDDASLRIELTSSGADSKRGLEFSTGANSSIVQGLAINDFGSIGILVDYDVHDVTIQGNFLGTDITGTVDLGNSGPGIQLRSNDNMVGGSNITDRNIISGNDNRGIAFFTFGTITGNVVQNNYIGVDATGLVGLGNDDYGLQLWNIDGAQVIDNVIAGNESEGILFRASSDVANVLIQGNMIGIGADGSTLIGNGSAGIRIDSDNAMSNVIDGNTIGGNSGDGIEIAGGATVTTKVVGNFIGTNLIGDNLLNGRHGILITGGASSTTVGGVGIGEANVIAFNTLSGVGVESTGINNSIRGNKFVDNQLLGINLVGGAETVNVTANDVNDGDGGPNNLQNYPVITSAVVTGSDMTVNATINSTPSTNNIMVDFYWSNIADVTGNGEAEFYLGSSLVNTDAAGDATIGQTFLSAGVPVGATVTATATDSNGNTSEFSLNVMATSANTAPVLGNNQLTLDEGETIVLTIANLSATDSTDPDPSLTFNVTSVNGGHFALTVTPMTPITSFSKAQVDAGDITFVDDGNETAPSYAIEVTDGSLTDGPVAGNITFSNVNDAPTVASPIGGVSVDEDASDAVINLASAFGDPDTSPLTYTVQSNSGPLLVDAAVAGDFLTLDFLTDEFGFATITVRATDGTLFVEDTINVIVNPINDAPVLTGSGGLPITLRNDFDPPGETIGSLLSSLVTDVDPSSSMTGIGIIGNSANPVTEGGWEYSTDSGSNWQIIGVVSDGPTALALSSSSLVRFVPVSNYVGTPPPLDVRAIDDTYSSGFTAGLTRVNIDSSINGGIASVSLAAATIETSVVTSGITVTPINGLTTNESGSTASFQVVLLSAPTSTVTLAAVSDNLMEGLTSTSILTFDATNWNLAQTVIVSGVDDSIDDGDIGYTIVLDAAVSTDVNYNGLDADDVSITNVDDDTAGVIVSASSVTTNENGQTATFDISLSSRPLATVSIGVASNDPTEGLASTSLLTFDPSNWNVPQTVIITGQPDTSADGDASFQIVLAPAVSSDPNFNSLDPVDVNVINGDFVAVVPLVATSEPEPETEDDEEFPEVVGSLSKSSSTVAPEMAAPQPKAGDNFANTFATEYQQEQPRVESPKATPNNWLIGANSKSVVDQSIEHIAQTYSHESVVLSTELWNDLDHLRERMQTDATLPTIVVGSVASMASMFTVGYVTWLIRGGQILVGVLARMPAWKLIDPLPILAALERDDDDIEDDSLASVVDNANENTNRSNPDESAQLIDVEALDTELASTL